ncbi:serine threonine kinase [Fusarium tjaetaba]|uniref:Serine threonine kinase n=1 Tax=Fusarium tjaetaba TaxID=1567544 RepID=A0A8H5V8Q6_9HYPO|nr:serine threonine kinase [Fusarium tjaetaba]KAF5614656.1 serine threonine kinase [Fusarium tjaetaba]
MTEDAINNTLERSTIPSHQHAETLQRVVESGRRIYSILALLDFYQYLANFIEGDQLDDAKLPFRIDTLQTLEIPEDDAKDFENKQWELLAPVFRRGTLNKRLDESLILPFTQEKRIGKGAFGTVYETVLDPNHQLLSGEFFPQVVARKEFHIKGHHHKELENLSILNHLKHANIVELLGSFTSGDLHNLFFPLASDGNLYDVLSSDRQADLFASSETMLVELAALSSAIEHVHDFSKENLDLELIGCHHDLRPRNILVSGSKLILADFGLSTLKPSSQNSETPFKHNGDDYLAPECEDWDNSFVPGKVHRSADIWSFGCIMAEIVTYLVSGREGVEEFRQKRKHKVRNWTFYQFHQGLDRPSDAVHQWLSDLETTGPTCTALLVKSICQTIAINQALRPTASSVTCKLRFIAVHEISVSINELFRQLKHAAPSIDMSLERERFRAWQHAIGLDDLKGKLSQPKGSGSSDESTMTQYSGIMESLRRLREDLQDRLSRGLDSQRLDLSRLVRLQDELHYFLDQQQKNASQAYFLVSLLSGQDAALGTLNEDGDQTLGAISHDLRMRANIRYINSLLVSESVGGQDPPRSGFEPLLSNQTILIDPSRIPKLKPIGDHHFGSGLLEKSDSDTIVSRPIWVEWRRYEHHGASEDTMAKLYARATQTANLLSQKKPDSFRTLDCLGLFHEPSRGAFGLLFEFPPYSSNPPHALTGTLTGHGNGALLGGTVTLDNRNKPVVMTLRDRLQKDNPTSTHSRAATAAPDLDDKFKLAATLATSLFELHTVGWLHKSLTSSNIVFFPSFTLLPDSFGKDTDVTEHGWAANSQSIREPYLVGFNHSRPDDPTTFTSGLTDSESRHYQHPAYLKAGVSYRLEFDYYSLGILLLEIGFWKPFSKITKDWSGSFEERRQRLLTNRVPKLAQHMGRDYSEASAAEECSKLEDDDIFLEQQNGMLYFSQTKSTQTPDHLILSLTHSTFLSSRLFSSEGVSQHSNSTSGWNLITFLAVVQKLEIKILPVAWEPGRQLIGRGGTSQINQSVVTLQASFAFKRVSEEDRLNKTEEDIYRCLINEVLVLCHPRVRGHSNILDLQGVCWDVSPENQDAASPDLEKQYRIWPVLVFEKSQLGDLFDFAGRPNTQKLTIMERWMICLDIGKAIAHMQSSNVIHGDIKPQNILIFKRDEGFTAKVADFGYSAWYASDDKHIVLPRSPLWHAPEIDEYPEFNLRMALQTDVYSFGLVCLWFMFYSYLSGNPPLPGLDLSTPLLHSDNPKERSLQLLSRLKSSNNSNVSLSQLVEHVLCQESGLDLIFKNSILCFFQGCLDPDTNVRSPDVQSSLQWAVNSDTADLRVTLTEMYFPTENDFKASLTIRSCIRHQLEEIVRSKPETRLSQQLKICYQLEFGRPDSATKVMSLYDGKPHETRLNPGLGTNGPGVSLFEQQVADGYLSPARSLIQKYVNDGVLDTAQRTIEADIESLRKIPETRFLVALLKSNLSLVFGAQGQWNKAENLEIEFQKEQANLLGNRNRAWLGRTLNLAYIYNHQGLSKKAEELSLQALETSNEILTKEHPDMQLVMLTLASTYWSQDRWDEAYELQRRVIAIRKRTLGEDHPDTLSSMNELATTYWAQGHWIEAEKYAREIVETSKTVLGQEDPHFLDLLSNLASIYRDIGWWDKAEDLEFGILETRLKVSGPEHPHTLASMVNLASTYAKRDRSDEALNLVTNALEISERTRGPEHPHTLSTAMVLASLLQVQDELEKAEKLMITTMETLKRLQGQHHSLTLLAMESLCSLYLDQARWEEAETLGQEVVDTSKEQLGEDHPRTLMTISTSAKVYRDQGKWESAEKIDSEVLDKAVKTLGEEHPETMTIMANLAISYWGLKKLDEAEALEIKVLEMKRRILGNGHPSTLTSIDNLAATYVDQGRWAEAEELELELFTTKAKTLNEDFSVARTTAETEAMLFWDYDDIEESERLWHIAIETRGRILGKDHYFTVHTMERLLARYQEDGRSKDSEQLAEQIRELKKGQREDSPSTNAAARQGGLLGLLPEYTDKVDREVLKDLGLEVQLKYR